MTRPSEPTHDTGEATNLAAGTVASEVVAGQVNTGPAAERATYDQLLALTRYRRSVRVIDPSRPVSDETIEKILEVARWAPSAGNSQPWEFVVIRDVDMRRRISETYVKQMAEKREMQEAVWGHRDHIGYTGFRKAPVYLIVLGDPRVIDAYPVRTALEKGNNHFISSLAQATVLMHLAVASLGLGSQWVSDVSSPYLGTMIKSWLEIPRYMKIYDMAGIGHPAVTPPVSYRRPLEEILHREKYEPTKVRDQAALEAFLWDHSILGGLRSTGGLKGIKPSTDSL